MIERGEREIDKGIGSERERGEDRREKGEERREGRYQ